MFYVKWKKFSDCPPDSNTLCVTMRGSLKGIEYYHEPDCWSGAISNPDYWAEWNHPELIGAPLSRERFELLCAIVSPDQVDTGLNDWS